MRCLGTSLFLLILLLSGRISSAADPEKEPLPSNLGTRKSGVDWPSFLGPTGDSKSPETGIRIKWRASAEEPGLKLVWSKPLGISYDPPTVSRGRLFLFDRFGDKARLYALNAETGAPLWKYEYTTNYEDLYGYNNGPRCSPIVDGNRVYAYGVEGMLVCVSADKGEEIWKVDTFKDFGVVQNFFGVGSTPVIEGDLLLVMVGGSPPESQRVAPGQLDRVDGNGSGVVAFDKRTGKVRYKITDELASYASMKTATIAGRRWGFAFCRGGLVGFEPATGKVDFHYPWRAEIIESVNASVPVVHDNQVFISETYGVGSSLLEVGPGMHKVVWKDDENKRAKAMKAHWNTPIYHDGYLFGCSGRNIPDADLRCIEWKTGKVQWKIPDLTRMSLTYIDGHFLCLAEDSVLRLIKVDPGKYIEVTSLALIPKPAGPRIGGEGSTAAEVGRDPFWAAPVVSHGLMYVRGGGKLFCYELIPEKK
ncbi:MAG: PQQ-like beta-propeller repeat protein [Planctomycetales bacterium]|nr:PQQ-like beta-propeller repeat protein [Planctomycetales bacterium]